MTAQAIEPAETRPPGPMTAQERRDEQERREAGRCADLWCSQLPPDHLDGCRAARMPDPSALQCRRCEYPAGSLGCRLTHGGAE